MLIQLSKNGKGKLVPRKNLLPLFIVFLISLFASCKKETTSIEHIDNSVSAQVASNDSVLASSTLFGVQISSGTLSMDQKDQICESIGVSYVRYSISIKDFTGTDKGYEKWISMGYKVLLNINYADVQKVNGSKKPNAFPTDMVAYKKSLESILDKYHPEVAVIENEPPTDAFHSGPIEDYITELKTAVDVCKARGIKVADGGLNVQTVNQVRGGYGKGTGYEETKKLLDAYKTIDLDYVNVHTHAPFYTSDNPDVFSPGILEDVADYVRTDIGKEIMSNEYNQWNESTLLMASAVDNFKAGGYKYMVARSNSDGKGKPLFTGTTLTAIGVAYGDAIK